MTGSRTSRGTLHFVGFFVFLTSVRPVLTQEVYNSDSAISALNCTTPDNFVSFQATNDSSFEDSKTQKHRALTDDFNKHFNNQRSNQYSNDQQSGRTYDLISNKRADDFNIDRYHDFYSPNKNLDDQQLHKKINDQRLDRKINDQQLDRHYEDQNTDPYFTNKEKNENFKDESSRRQLEDQDIDKSLRVRPLNEHIEDKHSNMNSDDHKLNRNLNEHLTRKYFDDKQTNKNFGDEQQNRNVDNLQASRNSENRNLEISSTGIYSDDQQLHRYSSDYTLNKNLDYQRPKDDQHDKYIDYQQSNRHLDADHLNRYYDNSQSENYDSQHLNKNNDNKYSNMNLNPNGSQSKNYDDSFNEHSNKNIDNQYSSMNLNHDNLQSKNYEDEYSNKNIDNKHSSTNLDHGFNKNREDQNSDLVNQYPNGHYDNGNLNRHLDDLQPDRRHSDQSFERRLIDHYLERYTGDTYPDRNRDDPTYNRRLTNQPDKIVGDSYRDNLKIDRRIADDNFKVNEQKPDKHLDDKFSNRHLDDINSGKQLEDPNFERHLENPHFNSDIQNPNFERHPVEPNPDKRVDNLQPDKRVDDQNFERHLVDPEPNRHVGSEIHSDRRLSDEHYARHGIDKISNRRKEEEHSIAKPDELHPDRRFDSPVFEDDTTIEPKKESNMSHLVSFFPREWEESRQKLIFPNKTGHERYRMSTMHLDKGLFLFDFLRYFLSVVQPRNFPLDLLKDTLEGRVNVSTLISQSIHLEIIFLTLITIFVILMFVVPTTECYLCCRVMRYKYQRRQQGSSLCFLCLFTIIIGTCIVTMLVCNEQVAGGIERFPETIEAALQDLRDYHSGTAIQLRKCLTRSLDVASEAILGDLDNVEELLGKPIQAQLSSETGVDSVLESLMEVANAASHDLAYKTDALIKKAERAREFGSDLSRDCDEIRRDLERAAHDCSVEDRSLCAVLDPSGLHLALRLDRVARDDRLLRLRSAGRDNLTEAARQARGEYLYVPHHVARTTLEARNQIRREVNTARAKVSDEARSIEASGSDVSNQLDTARRFTNQIVPYVRMFERIRWYVGFGTAMCILFIWLLLFGALCCRCGSSEERVRPTLLWFAFFGTIISICLWIVLMAALAIASHAEMLLCRPLDDPEYRTVEAILETRHFFGRRLSVPLRDLLQKCEQNDSTNQGYQLDNPMKLEQITAHWQWSSLTRAFSKLKVDLTGLRILPANLRERLQNLLYATGANLTEHRVMIQGPILNKDLNALSDQVENVARQLSERRTARTFQTLAAQMRDLLSRRVKPLMKMQDELVYQLAALELHLQPIQQKTNHTLSQLRNVQYYIDNQGEKIGQIKTKYYVDRLSNYLDQWRAHVLTEMSSGASKCRPLWDILRGIKLLFCSHILGPLNGFWFAAFICAVTLLFCIPTAHNLATSYWRQPSSRKGSVLLPSRQGSPDTVVMERETWRSPDPPPSMDSW